VITKEQLSILPMSPGCYIYKNIEGIIIYVGKAKNLYNRVHSYFTGQHNGKTMKLISEIDSMDFIITNTERESLLLELNLIKLHTPRYNIKLTDDATYSYITITKETNPRVLITKTKKEGEMMFGPFPDSYSAKQTVWIINNLYKFRKCNKLPKKECLYFHMGKCFAPCINKTPIDYKEIINEVRSFLKGNNNDIVNTIKEKMDESSSKLEFEKAIEYRQMIEYITKTTEKQIITFHDYVDRDAIGVYYVFDQVVVSILIMRAGRIVSYYGNIFYYVLDPYEYVVSFLNSYYNNVYPDEILVDNILGEYDFGNLEHLKVIPKIGDKKKLVSLSQDNAIKLYNNENRLKLNKDESVKLSIDELSLFFEKTINRIDCFDTSFLFGSSQVAAMIVFEDFGLSKKEYRKYRLSNLITSDFSGMKEVLYRRYYRMLVEDLKKPDLILVDGGKPQILACMEVLESLNLNILVGGLRKNDKHQLEALLYNDKELILDKHTSLYKLLLSLSEEVHRFAITYHKNVRGNEVNKSFLDGIEGIGEKRKKLLLTSYQSLDELKNAQVEDLIKLGIPSDVSKRIRSIIECLK
jgi:excinuclease ABC subunit C